MLNNLKATPHQNISMIFEPQPTTQQVVVPSTAPKIETLKSNKNVSSQIIVQRENIEVSVDPEMFLADEESIIIEDDEETVSAAEAKFEDTKLETQLSETLAKENSFENIQPVSSEIIKNFNCTSCPEIFTTITDLQSHAITHVITSTTSSATSTKNIESAIEKLSRKKKPKQDKMKRKRKVIIRINPGPSKRSSRLKSMINPFMCALCKRSLSSKRNLQSHIETHKEPSGKFKCDGEGCKKLFANLENFVKHRQEHEKPSRKRKRVNEK